jgi:hypothetical protein
MQAIGFLVTALVLSIALLCGFLLKKHLVVRRKAHLLMEQRRRAYPAGSDFIPSTVNEVGRRTRARTHTHTCSPFSSLIHTASDPATSSLLPSLSLARGRINTACPSIRQPAVLQTIQLGPSSSSQDPDPKPQAPVLSQLHQA